MNEEVARALVIESGGSAFTPAIALGDDTLATLQVLVISAGGTTIGVTGTLQGSNNLLEWEDIPSSMTTAITVAPDIKRKSVSGIISAYIRTRFDNAGPYSAVVRARLATSSTIA